MPKWHREYNETDDDLDQIETVEDTTLSAEEKNWKKRYGDLRSHSQKQINDLNVKITDISRQLSESANNNIKLPKTPEEIKEWAATYPDVAAIVRTIAIEENTRSRTELDELRKKIDEDALQNLRDKATVELDRIHPDFFPVIRDSEEFEEWLQTKSSRTRDALYENDTDASAAADVIALYKAETGISTNSRKADNRDAARNVRVNSRTPEPVNRGDYEFTESQINAMGMREYEEKEPAINKAMRENRVLLDVTGAAR